MRHFVLRCSCFQVSAAQRCFAWRCCSPNLVFSGQVSSFYALNVFQTPMSFCLLIISVAYTSSGILLIMLHFLCSCCCCCLCCCHNELQLRFSYFNKVFSVIIFIVVVAMCDGGSGWVAVWCHLWSLFLFIFVDIFCILISFICWRFPSRLCRFLWACFHEMRTHKLP